LTADEICDLLPRLRARPYRWAHARPTDDAGDWIGHAVAAATRQSLVRTAATLGDILKQLQTLGLIERIRIQLSDRHSIHVARVVRSYRVRLHPSGERERAALSGKQGQSYAAIPAAQEAAV
jgi:hypothetical protein